jgi:hypothetical protein
MKQLFVVTSAAAIGLVTGFAALTTPALANSMHSRHSGWNARAQADVESYAAADPTVRSGPYGAPTAYVIQGDNETIGADPDPAVRLSLMRDAPTAGQQ